MARRNITRAIIFSTKSSRFLNLKPDHMIYIMHEKTENFKVNSKACCSGGKQICSRNFGLEMACASSRRVH